jgi:membrane associated rhomboid family serine protease
MIPIRDVNPTRIFPILTIAFLVANVAVYFFWQPRAEQENLEFTYENAAIACEVVTGEPLDFTEINEGICLDSPSGAQPFPDKDVRLAVLVSLFLHGGLLHLGGNMLFLWIFGNNVEEAFGTLGFLAMYAASGVAATAAFVALNSDSTIPLIGASGAIAGVMGAYFILFPTHRVQALIIWIIPYVVALPAALLLGFWFVLQFLVAQPGVAWEAHAAGFIFGALLALVLRPRLLARVERLHQPGWDRYAG